MSCYGCGSSFGAFKKERGCKNCGFAFCTKCLPHTIAVPKRNNERHHVCLKCYNILTGKTKPKEDDPAKYSPPENYKKRVAALQERESHGASRSDSKLKGPSPGKGQYKGMSQTDIEIQQRLEKLKEKSPKEAAAANVTNKEIDDRLARLKGMDPARYNTSNKPTYHPPDRRTQQEQMNDLLDEISNEVELDSKLPDPATEIAARLARLKDEDKVKHLEQPDTDENNLNKPSLRDSQTFSQNIKETKTSSAGKITSDSKKPGNSEWDEISAEEIGKILNEASLELEKDAEKALKGLEDDKDIMKKLQEVKQRRKDSAKDVNKDEEPFQSDSENEDERDEVMADKIIKQFVEESKLDEAAGRDGIKADSVPSKGSKASLRSDKSNNSEEWEDEGELPYCCICTEDATVRCFGCDRDLYCQKCFSEGHKELGLTDHAFIKYTPPKTAC